MTDWYKKIPPIRISKRAEKSMGTILTNLDKLILTSIEKIERTCRPRNLKLGIKRMTRKTNDVSHHIRITGYQVDNLPKIGSSFRIVSFCSLALFLLLLGLGFIYENVDKKKGSRCWKELTFTTFTCNLVLVLLNNRGKILSLESFVINGRL